MSVRQRDVVYEDGASSGHGHPPPSQCHNAVDFKNQPTVLARRKGEGNMFSVHALQACRGSRGIAPHILSLGTTRK